MYKRKEGKKRKRKRGIKKEIKESKYSKDVKFLFTRYFYISFILNTIWNRFTVVPYRKWLTSIPGSRVLFVSIMYSRKLAYTKPYIFRLSKFDAFYIESFLVDNVCNIFVELKYDL